jgi:acetyl-CoA carboxylase beta subunit
MDEDREKGFSYQVKNCPVSRRHLYKKNLETNVEICQFCV